MKKTEQRILKRILKSLSNYKWEMGGIILCYLVVTVTSFLSPILIAKITDEGMLQKTKFLVWRYTQWNAGNSRG